MPVNILSASSVISIFVNKHIHTTTIQVAQAILQHGKKTMNWQNGDVYTK
jgi:hypothetical protein